MVRRLGAAALAALLTVACTTFDGAAVDGKGGAGSNDPNNPGDPNDPNNPNNPNNPGGTDPPPTGSGPAVPSTIPKQGTLVVNLTADAAGNDVAVSMGVPFPQGVLMSEKDITLKNAAGTVVPIGAAVLAKWPGDNSIRSVLVTFKATLASGAKAAWSLDYGAPSATPPTAAATPNPDGPIMAHLTAEHYSKSLVSGVLLPATANKAFAGYETALEAGSKAFNYTSYGVDCNAAAGRTYYDGPHALYQRFLRTAVPAQYRLARRESMWFRANELRFSADRKTAVQKCEPAGWTPSKPMDWGTLRMMLSQGSLDDYLLTGDPAAKEAVLAMGEAYRLNIPALTSGNVSLEITERNLGWTLIGLASYYALDGRAEVRDATKGLVTRAVAWQARGQSGALEHDLNRPDPDECGNGPNGASPFMTSIVVDGLMDYWLLTNDTATLQPFMQKLASWYETKAITSDKLAFRYLWNCKDDPYDDSSTADLNILINHVFGAAYMLTKDTHWLDFGDKMAASGIENFSAKAPKQFAQSARTFGKYLGYRSLGKAP